MTKTFPDTRLSRIFAGLALSLCLGLATPAPANQQSTPAQETETMRVRDLYPLITTPALFETRDFYVKHFGFDVLFEASWFVYLSAPGEEGTRGATLAFMTPDHPSTPPGPESFDGKGMILTVEVSDAAAHFERISAAGAPIVHPLTDEAWGQRRFMTRDPSGVLVDVVEQTAPQEGFWEKYPAPTN